MLKVHQGNSQNGGGMFHMHARGTVGLSPYISLVFPKILMASRRYLKYFQRFKRKISISATHQNYGIKCLKFKGNL